MRVFIRILIIASVSICSFTSQATHLKNDSIDKRTSPIGQVYLEGEETEAQGEHSATSTVTAEPRSGESIYNSLCIACHSTGLANAPKAGDTEIWAQLMAGGIDTLLSSAITGKDVMPPKGNCFDCSDDELKSAIQFMSEPKN